MIFFSRLWRELKIILAPMPSKSANNPLCAVSPIDGRYKKYTEPLVKYWSECASMKYKIIAEGEYLIALAEEKGVNLRKFSAKEKNIKATNHDFKAIEYYIKDKLGRTSLRDVLEYVHFGLTSEDAGNIAYALMLGESLRNVYLPEIKIIINKIEKLARENKNIPMLARTHGQPASPTTLGKEFRIYAERLNRQLKQLQTHKLATKLNGATGNYNALYAAYPRMDWLKFSQKLIYSIGRERGVALEANIFTTQIESHDSYVELFDIMRRINYIIIDFNQDMWRYISDGWLLQKPKIGEIGSSTMPHKINPWFLENSEGNLGMANALFEFFARKLPISRLQRDLSDSTVLRNIGTAFGP